MIVVHCVTWKACYCQDWSCSASVATASTSHVRCGEGCSEWTEGHSTPPQFI